MQTHEPSPREDVAASESLEQEVRALRERLAFYEGFDRLIQDNVAQARELFRLAAQERETTAAEGERLRRDAGDREAHLRSELKTVAAEVAELAAATEALSERISRILAQSDPANGAEPAAVIDDGLPVAVVVHGVQSAQDALSLQRFVASLPQVNRATAREFGGGVLRIDAHVSDPLRLDQFRAWNRSAGVERLTERAGVLEFAVRSDSG